MNIKKSLLALLAAAMATMAFASPAMATDGFIRDATTNETIHGGTALHLVGWTKFTTGGSSLECHVTSIIKSITGSTGEVSVLTTPDTTKCKGAGALNGCTVKTDEAKNLPYDITVTENGRVDISGKIELHNTYSGCLVKTTLVKLSELTLTPLATGTRAITGGTAGNALLGGTAALNEPVAGFEVDGFTANGKVQVESSLGTKSEEALAGFTGEVEFREKEDRCTYKITAI